jgi:hypothetical protein
MLPDNDDNNAAVAFVRGKEPKAVGRKMPDDKWRNDQWNDPGDGFGNVDKSMALSIPTEKELDVLMRVGKALIASGIAKHLKTPEAALTVILTGREMGLAPMASIRGIDLIMERPFVKPILMLAVARRSGQLEMFNLVKTEQKATCTIKRRGYEQRTFTVTIEDAKKRGWFDKNAHNYKSQPSTMLGHRVTGEALKDQFTDYFMGMGLPGDEGEIENFNDARRDFHANDEPKHVNQGEIMIAEIVDGPKKTDLQRDRERKLDDPQYESAALDAETTDPLTAEFIDDETAMKAEEFTVKLADAGLDNDDIDSIIETATGVRSIEHVAAGDGQKLIAALAKALTEKLNANKKARFK